MMKGIHGRVGIDVGYIDKAAGPHSLTEAREIGKKRAALIKAGKSVPHPSIP